MVIGLHVVLQECFSVTDNCRWKCTIKDCKRIVRVIVSSVSEVRITQTNHWLKNSTVTVGFHSPNLVRLETGKARDVDAVEQLVQSFPVDVISEIVGKERQVSDDCLRWRSSTSNAITTVVIIISQRRQ